VTYQLAAKSAWSNGTDMDKIVTIVKKEWAEVFKNRMVLFSVIFLPLLLTLIPLAILFTTRGDDAAMQSADMPGQVNAFCPPDLEGGECFQVYMVSQFMLMFMILPLAIPSSISAYSIVGEKTSRTLEPLLATPITTLELLAAKSLAALLPAMLATFTAFGVFALGARVMISNSTMYAAIFDLRWLIAIFLVGPLLALVSVNFSVIVSSRVNDPRVAEQLTALLIVPLLAVFFGQMAGLFVINRELILIGAVFVLLIDVILIFLSIQIFDRETILTRWK
jgi:ABC-2 type transport system permease protein